MAVRFKIGETISAVIEVMLVDSVTGALSPATDASGWTITAQGRKQGVPKGAPALTFVPTFISGNRWQIAAPTSALKEAMVIEVDVRAVPPLSTGAVISDTLEMEIELPVTR